MSYLTVIRSHDRKVAITYYNVCFYVTVIRTGTATFALLANAV